MSWSADSLGSRILLVFLGLFTGALGFLFWQMAGAIEQSQRQGQLSQLQLQALMATRVLEDPLSGYRHEEDHDDEEHGRDRLDRGRLESWARNYAADTGLTVAVLGPRGELLTGLGAGDPDRDAELVSARQGERGHRQANGLLYVAAPVHDGHHLLGYVRLAAVPERTMSRQLTSRLLLTCAVALVGAVLAALWLIGRLVGPLRKLEQAALAAAEGRLDQPIEVRGRDELASLSRAFRRMLEQISLAMERQRRFIADASHELRTPLTSLKLRSEALLTGGLEDPAVARPYLKEIDREVDRLSRLANHLLDLSRLQHRRPAPPTDPLPTLRALAERAARTAEQARVRLSVELPDELPALAVAPEELEQMVGNLLDNALKYTPADGTVGLRCAREGAVVSLEVSDSGPGIAPEDLAHVFESFYRADRARRREGGTGLGLAIVHQLAVSLGGRVEARSQPGQGARFRLELPLP